MSIRQRLLFWLLLVVAIAIGLAGIGIYHRARVEANHLFDYHLKQIALTLQDHAPDESNFMGTLEEEIDFDFVIQVWADGGVKLYFSHPHKALPPQMATGYHYAKTDEGEWRVYTMRQGAILIQVAQPMDIRADLATKLAFGTLKPAALLLLVLGALIWYIVGRGLRPLEQLANAVRASDVNTLSPISPENLPRELKPLAVALNDLLSRLEGAMQTQRDFVADAAHELRTPLTALQLQAQLAERAATPIEREQGFARLKEGLKRATHLVGQLLLLARQEAETPPPFAPIDLSALVNSVAIDYAEPAHAKKIRLHVNASAAIVIYGDGDAIRIMIRNVIDNAIRYAPESGNVDVSVTQSDGTSKLIVEDSGPGISAAERSRVFDRFYRSNENTGSGSGLGLAIVKRIAENHGIDIQLSDRRSGRGLRIEFSFRKSP